jgi:hypothetical protein
MALILWQTSVCNTVMYNTKLYVGWLLSTYLGR